MMRALDLLSRVLIWPARIMLWVGVIVYVFYALDRSAPFEVLNVPYASARPGEHIKMRLGVRRDAARMCDVEMSRYVYTADQTRFDLGQSTFSAWQILQMEKALPGELMLSFKVPEAAEPGQARLVSVLEYHCNKLHRIWPIIVTTEVPFVVE